jgi:hypothetical protein
MDNNLEIVTSNIEENKNVVLNKVGNLANEIIHSEEDYFMDILSVVQKYRMSDFKAIITDIIENKEKINHVLYAKNLKNIVDHLLNIIKNNDLENLSKIILVKDSELYLLSEQLNNYITIISEKNKEIVGTELCIISAILNNMYDELLGVFVKKSVNTWTGPEWISDDE